MALSVTGTGPYNYDSAKGSQVNDGYANYNFFSGSVAGITSTYQVAPDPTVLIFGCKLSELVIINNGSNDLVFQWFEGWAALTPDHGIVLANSTIILRRCFKQGMRLRCGETGSTTSALVWGL